MTQRYTHLLLPALFCLCVPLNGHILDDINEMVQSIFFHHEDFPNDPAEYEPELHYEKPEGFEENEILQAQPETAKTIYKEKHAIRLSDVKGHDETVSHIKNMIRQFRNPMRMRLFGGRPKKGLLLEGPSGTGKTMLARAIANELGYSFHEFSGSSFVEVWVGQGAQRIREAFATAHKTAPAVLFFDEIDAIAAVDRAESSSNGSLEYRQTLNEFLTQMNQLTHDTQVLVICATNTVEAIDQAFKEPHRFEIVTVGLPDSKGRHDILSYYLSRLPRCSCQTALPEVIKKTKGFSGARIESLVNTAVHLAIEDKEAHAVQDKHLLTALEMARDAMKTGMFGSASVEYDNVTFEDIAGMQNVISEFKTLVRCLEAPDMLRTYGAQMPKGILLSGPPGVGKTLMVRALANEANCSFFYAAGSQFDGKYMGQGAKRIRDLFDKARMVSPSVIFIDEIDAISRKAGGEQTLNELLTQMDGFKSDSDILVIGATNLVHEVDFRLKRAGRFTKIISISVPNSHDRQEILEMYIRRLPRVVHDQVPYEKLVQETGGMSSSALKELVNEAAMIAYREKSMLVDEEHFLAALDHIKRTHRFRR